MMPDRKNIRHTNLGRVIYSELCRNLDFEHTDNWFEQEPSNVLESKKYTILLDFYIQTNKILEA